VPWGAAVIALPAGQGMSVLTQLRPIFFWDALRGVDCSGGPTQLQAVDNNAIGSTDYALSWDAGRGQFVMRQSNSPLVFGACGEFSDGPLNNLWVGGWASDRLGFSDATSGAVVSTDTATQAIHAVGLTAWSAVVDTDTGSGEAWAFVRAPFPLSTVYRRCGQVLVRSHSALAPSQAACAITLDSVPEATAKTDAYFGGTVRNWLPNQADKAPADRWFALRHTHPANAGAASFWVRLPNNSGLWTLTYPACYSAYSTYEGIFRSPAIPGWQRGGWYLRSVSSTVWMPPVGWVAVSVAIPDASASRGHRDHNNALNWGFAILFSWQANNGHRIRLLMSDTYDKLAFQIENNGTIAYLDLPGDWYAWERLGIVVTWGYSNQKNYANLYVNGVKQDSEFDAATWINSTGILGTIGVGGENNGSSMADCWVQRCAVGRGPLHRSQAAALSVAMGQALRCADAGVAI